MFQKLMVANRGEIACRIIKTARNLGIRTLAIYSDSDKNSAHVLLADEACYVGPSEARKSYLNIKKIFEIAVEKKVDAIHPGYGFLSENHVFSKKVNNMGIIFVGPEWKAIKTMGNKKNAKQAISKAGIPMVPGHSLQENMRSESLLNDKTLEYPLLIKAAAGGGGKGMRIVLNESELEGSIQSVKREALSSFGDDEIIIEKYIQGGKHIEVQIAADHFGNIIHLMERDCSAQRRYQKVLEESPATSIPQKIKEKMYEAAIAVSRAINYTNLGTVEFIVDTSGKENDMSFYFLEMNTRLQVEHPITEAILGIDLVEMQLKIAAGKKLTHKQQDIKSRGHAIEARIYAENPRKNFMPSTGNISELRFPKNVRLDFGVKQGDQVESHYDPMLGKLIVHDVNRELAQKKMSDCLREFKIKGINTNLEFLYKLNCEPRFLENIMQVDSVEAIAEKFRKETALHSHFASAAILFLFLQNKFEKKMWRIWGERGTSLRLSHHDRFFEIKLIAKERGLKLFLANDSYEVSDIEISAGVIEFTLRGYTIKYEYERENEIVRVFDNGTIFDFELQQDYESRDNTEINEGKVIAPITGTVVKILKKNGQMVSMGEPLIIMEAMKMEYELKAPKAGRIKKMKVKTKEIINQNDILVEID